MADAEPQDALMYFEPAGTVRGSSLDSAVKGKDAFELTDFTLNAENSTNIGSSTGGGSGAGKVKFDRLSIKKYTDKATADILNCLILGKHIDKGYIELRANGLLYMKYTFSMCVIASCETTQSGEDESEDSIVVDYGAVKIEHYGQNDKGEFAKDAEIMWSRVTNDSSESVAA